MELVAVAETFWDRIVCNRPLTYQPEGCMAKPEAYRISFFSPGPLILVNYVVHQRGPMANFTRRAMEPNRFCRKPGDFSGELCHGDRYSRADW